jgi:GNAT superfamily N-acetyltransferase
LIEITPVRDSAEIETVARLAYEIWSEHCVPIIGLAQVQYMVPKFQSAAAITAQIADGLEYFLIGLEGAAAGYFAIQRQPEKHSLFLSKLYVRKDMRGRGLARHALSYIDAVCKGASLTTIWLTVNKRNAAVGSMNNWDSRMWLQSLLTSVMDSSWTTTAWKRKSQPRNHTAWQGWRDAP